MQSELNPEIREITKLTLSENVDFEISPVKKERLRRKKNEIIRQKLRDELPVLTKQEVRRHRVPYHEALLAELNERGFHNTADFLEQLLELQEKMRKKAGPGTQIFMRPQLKYSKANLDLLIKSLSASEKAHVKGLFSEEWDQILRLAAHYAFGPDDWWWLGEQLLFQCVSMDYPEFHRQEAISYFIIGKYLVENGKKMESGKHYLDLAREMSQGKSWTCAKMLNTKMDIVFIESCRLLYKTLTEEAVTIMKTDPQKAADICNTARKRAAEACDHNAEYEALLLRGKCELLLNESSDAIATVTKALNRTVRRKTIKGILEAKIALALASLQHGKAAECMKSLQELKQLAEEHEMPFYVAQAYRFMGEYYLYQKLPKEATPLLLMAFFLFHELGDLGRRERVRIWAAISAGEELFPAFINLIQTSDNTEEGQEYLMKLIRWIDEKEFFWTQKSKFSFSVTSLRRNIFDAEE